MLKIDEDGDRDLKMEELQEKNVKIMEHPAVSMKLRSSVKNKKKQGKELKVKGIDNNKTNHNEVVLLEDSFDTNTSSVEFLGTSIIEENFSEDEVVPGFSQNQYASCNLYVHNDVKKQVKKEKNNVNVARAGWRCSMIYSPPRLIFTSDWKHSTTASVSSK